MVQKAILIIGMHRSGSSLLAGMLHACEIDLGKKLLPPLPENPKGFFENAAFYQLNEDILHQLGTDWSEIETEKAYNHNDKTRKLIVNKVIDLIKTEFGSSPLICIKDPRISLLFSYYYEALSNLNIEIILVNCTRDKMEISKSLHKRNHFKMSYGMALTLHYSKCVSALKKRFMVIDIDYKDTLRDPISLLEKLKKSTQLSFTIKSEAIKAIVAKDLYRSKSSTGNSLFYILGYVTYYRIKLKKWLQYLL